MLRQVNNKHLIDASFWSSVLIIHISFIAVLKQYFFRECNDVDIIDYQGCQPVNEKLSDQPNKIITFSPKLFSNLRNTPHNMETFKLTR
jgi:hypothetical protein